MSGYNIEVAINSSLGEGPHWSADGQQLYYVDILSNAVHRHNPTTGENAIVKLDGRIGFVIPVDQTTNRFLVGVERQLRLLEWDGISTNPENTTVIYSVDPEHPYNRWNDGKCDTQGRLWAGTMYDGPEGGGGNLGSLYSMDLGGILWRHVRDIGVSNGLAWNATNTTMYYNDTATNRIDAFDFNAVAGTISNRRPVFNLSAEGVSGAPDGMTIDANGNLWVGTWGGSKILNVNPNTGQLIGTVDMPTKNITSVAFGGPNLDILYCTSARIGLSAAEIAAQPSAGTLFKITNVGARGASGGVGYRGRLPV